MNNYFLKEKATNEIITNVASFCSECYIEIIEKQTIFYDMKNYCYLCESCQSVLNEQTDINFEITESNTLFK